MVEYDEKQLLLKKTYPTEDRLNGKMGKINNLFLGCLENKDP